MEHELLKTIIYEQHEVIRGETDIVQREYEFVPMQRPAVVRSWSLRHTAIRAAGATPSEGRSHQVSAVWRQGRPARYDADESTPQ